MFEMCQHLGSEQGWEHQGPLKPGRGSLRRCWTGQVLHPIPTKTNVKFRIHTSNIWLLRALHGLPFHPFGVLTQRQHRSWRSIFGHRMPPDARTQRGTGGPPVSKVSMLDSPGKMTRRNDGSSSHASGTIRWKWPVTTRLERFPPAMVKSILQ